jgi:hypothetical protein
MTAEQVREALGDREIDNEAALPNNRRMKPTREAKRFARLTDDLLTGLILRSHEPPRNSGEGTAVNGPMPLAGGDESQTHEHE